LTEIITVCSGSGCQGSTRWRCAAR